MERPLDEAIGARRGQGGVRAVTADDVRVNIDASGIGASALRRQRGDHVGTGHRREHRGRPAPIGDEHATVTIHGVRPADVAAAARHALELARVAPDDPGVRAVARRRRR